MNSSIFPGKFATRKVNPHFAGGKPLSGRQAVSANFILKQGLGKLRFSPNGFSLEDGKETACHAVPTGVSIQPSSPFLEVDIDRPWDWQGKSSTGLSSRDLPLQSLVASRQWTEEPGRPVGEEVQVSKADAWQRGVLDIASAVSAIKYNSNSLQQSAVIPTVPHNLRLEHSLHSSVSLGSFNGESSSASQTKVHASLAKAGKRKADFVMTAEVGETNDCRLRNEAAETEEKADDPFGEVPMEEKLPEMKELLALLEARAKERKEEQKAAGDQGDSSEDEMGCGSVWLVGTGPGDPELLTGGSRDGHARETCISP